jgi:hypothetical protein
LKRYYYIQNIMPFIAGPRVTGGTGGTISTNSSYTIHTFETNGSFLARGTGVVEVLVVGSGGFPGPSANSRVGSGGGSVIYQKFVPVLNTGLYSVVVGTGNGAPQVNAPAGNSSQFDYNGGTIIAPGGGGTGTNRNNPLGSGGGGTIISEFGIGANVLGYGFSGGDGLGSGAGGGGGGAGGVGDPAASVTPGRGGIGVSYSISGVSTYYGGGGGVYAGSAYLHPTSTASMYGLGGCSPIPGTIPNRPGIVIIRYAT